MSDFFVNHSPAAQESITFFAYLLVFESSKISLNESKINKVSLRAFAASSPNSSIFKQLIKGSIL